VLTLLRGLWQGVENYKAHRAHQLQHSPQCPAQYMMLHVCGVEICAQQAAKEEGWMGKKEVGWDRDRHAGLHNILWSAHAASPLPCCVSWP